MNASEHTHVGYFIFIKQQRKSYSESVLVDVTAVIDLSWSDANVDGREVGHVTHFPLFLSLDLIPPPPLPQRSIHLNLNKSVTPKLGRMGTHFYEPFQIQNIRYTLCLFTSTYSTLHFLYILPISLSKATS